MSEDAPTLFDNKNILIILILLVVPIVSVYIYERFYKKSSTSSKNAKSSRDVTSSLDEIYSDDENIHIPDNKLKNIHPQTNNCLVADSKIPGGGRGVYALKDFKIGDVIEACPYLLEKDSTTIDDSVISDYVFNYVNDETQRIIVLGLCSMYNHSDNNNVIYKQITNPDNMVYIAQRNITKGDELFINYGENYWDTRHKEKL